ncbi:uncharacterized protein LOC144656313 [Oculina patagonica]
MCNHVATVSKCQSSTSTSPPPSAYIFDYICDCKADLFAITETWLCPDDAAVRAEVCPDGYNFNDHPRVGRRGGGTGLVYRDSLDVKKVAAGEKESFEFSEWTEQLLITGDFNIHVNAVDDPDAIKLLDLLESVGLRQHVTQPTHVHGHTLDLIITRWSEQIIQDPPHIHRFISDHASVLCTFSQNKPGVTTNKLTYRKLKSVNLDSLKNDLAASGLCQEQPDEFTNLMPEAVDALVSNYNSTLSKLTNCHAPLKTKTFKARPRVPWYNAEIDAAKRKRRKAERTWRKSKLPSDLIAFKSWKNHVTYLMNQARRSFYTNFINENSADQGRLFKATKKLLARKNGLSFPDYHDKTTLANDINDFFIRKIARIRSGIDATDVDLGACGAISTDPEVIDHRQCPSLSAFRPLTEGDVFALIQKSAKKSCLMDPMPTSLVVNCLDVLLPVITCIVNSSLSSGYFPLEWKQALVSPLLKKDGLDSVFKNLRPVSNLQFPSKLTERAVFDQIYNHMMDFSLYPALQSAYRKYHSTETALLKVQNDILMNMNRQHVTLLVLLDLSAAFDTVDHKILLHRLQSSLGVTGTALKWFESYLSNRSQQVVLGGCHSGSCNLPHGVPQGSCLGPLLFTIYSSKLFEVIKDHLPVAHAYADDTQLYLSFKPVSTSSQSEAIEARELCIKAIRAWMITDKLKLNDDKTEFLIIGTRQQLNKVNIEKLSVGDVSVAPVAAARNLGTWFDTNLSLVTHITKTCFLISF